MDGAISTIVYTRGGEGRFIFYGHLGQTCVLCISRTSHLYSCRHQARDLILGPRYVAEQSVMISISCTRSNLVPTHHLRTQHAKHMFLETQMAEHMSYSVIQSFLLPWCNWAQTPTKPKRRHEHPWTDFYVCESIPPCVSRQLRCLFSTCGAVELASPMDPPLEYPATTCSYYDWLLSTVSSSTLLLRILFINCSTCIRFLFLRLFLHIRAVLPYISSLLSVFYISRNLAMHLSPHVFALGH